MSFELPLNTSSESSMALNDTEQFLNSSDYFDSENKSKSLTFVVPTLFFIIFVVGVIGNGTLIIIFVMNKALRNVPNTYIISLALGDLLVLFLTVPFVSLYFLLHSWPFGTFLCKFSDMVRDISIGVTVFTLTALSADRYFAIVSPVKKAVEAAGGATLKVTLTIWMLSIILAIPSAAFSDVIEFNDVKVCYPFHDYLPSWYPQANIVSKAIIYYVLPLVIITSFYLLMARHLVSSDMPGEQQILQKQRSTRRKVAKIVLCFVVIFAICFLPTHVFLLWFYFTENPLQKMDEFWMAVKVIGSCLSFINSCINPIALYCISGTFRKQFNKYLFCCFSWIKSKNRNGQSTQSVRSGLTRYRSSTLRPSEAMTQTSILQERVSPATS